MKLGADDAELHGDQIKTENQGGQPNIGFWDKGNEWASWKIRFPKAGAFTVAASCAATSDAAEFVVEVAGQKLTGKASQTGAWDQFKEISLGRIEINQPGEQTLSVRPKDPATWRAMNLRAVMLSRIE